MLVNRVGERREGCGVLGTSLSVWVGVERLESLSVSVSLRVQERRRGCGLGLRREGCGSPGDLVKCVGGSRQGCG